MKHMKVEEIMTKDLITVKPSDSVKDAAKIIVEKRIDGIPVVDDDNNLVGLITEGDLIMADVKMHFPTYIHLLDGYIYLGSLKKFEQELKKAVGAKIKNVMTKDVITTTKDETVEDIATLMTEKGISKVPVLDGKKLIGIVTKKDIVKAISRS